MARHTLKIVMILLAGLLVLPVEAARLYKWVDEYGNVSYQDKPPPEGQGKVTEKTLGEQRGASTGDAAMDAAAAKAPITLYATAKCAQCDLARAFLKKRKLPFADIDVSGAHPEAQQEMKKKVGEIAVPTIMIGTKVMKGYLESLLEGELDAAGYPKPAENPEAGEGAPAQQ